MKKVITIISITLLLFATIVSGSPSTTVTASASSDEYSGEDYFRGIIFGQGEIAEKLTKLYSQEELESLNEFSESEEYQAAVNDIIEYIKEREPTLIEDFKESVDNQDPYALTNNLNKTDSILQDYSKKISDENGDLEFDVNACTPLLCGLVAGLIIAVAVHLVAGATQVAGTVIGVGKWVTFDSNKSDEITNNEHVSYLILTNLNE